MSQAPRPIHQKVFNFVFYIFDSLLSLLDSFFYTYIYIVSPPHPTSIIVSFSFYTPNPDNDGKKVQDFYLSMEAAIMEHPLWAAATFEELDSAMEVLTTVQLQ